MAFAQAESGFGPFPDQLPRQSRFCPFVIESAAQSHLSSRPQRFLELKSGPQIALESLARNSYNDQGASEPVAGGASVRR